MNKQFKITIQLLLVLAGVRLSSQNLIDTSEWIAGANVETLANFDTYGGSQHNTIENLLNPHGVTTAIWKISSGTAGYPAMRTNAIYPDKNKTYRFTVWLKQSDPFNVTELGIEKHGDEQESFIDGQSALQRDLFMQTGNSLPASNEWFLYVGFIKGQNDTNTYTGGVYSIANGQEIVGVPSDGSQFNSVFTYLRFQVWTGGSNDTSNYILVHEPSIYEVNGQEPTISELLNPSGTDTQDPTAPTVSSTGHTDTTVDLSWSGATDNVGVTGYNIYKDGALEASSTSSPYTTSGLTAATTYSFTVSALDAAGNESTVSNAVSVTTDSSPGGGGGSSVWSESGSTASYSGEVGIGTSSVPSGYKLAVDGNIRTREIRVDQDTWPDYVFEEGYDLLTLEEIQKHINEKGHLPNIPSAQEVQANGMDVGEMNKLLLEKIEELILHSIRQEQLLQQQQMQILQLAEKLGIEDNLNK